MSAFAAALRVLIADTNLGSNAAYRAGGEGPPARVRVLRSSPDQVATGLNTGILSATDILTVSIEQIGCVEPGDLFEVGADLLTVQYAEQDATGTAWRIYCQS